MLFHLLSGCFPFCASRQWRNPGRNEGLPSAATRHYPPPLPHAYVPPVSPCLSPSSVQDPQHKISQGGGLRGVGDGISRSYVMRCSAPA